jgi:hypothetical protein
MHRPAIRWSYSRISQACSWKRDSVCHDTKRSLDITRSRRWAVRQFDTTLAVYPYACCISGSKQFSSSMHLLPGVFIMIQSCSEIHHRTFCSWTGFSISPLLLEHSNTALFLHGFFFCYALNLCFLSSSSAYQMTNVCLWTRAPASMKNDEIFHGISYSGSLKAASYATLFFHTMSFATNSSNRIHLESSSGMPCRRDKTQCVRT